MTNDKTEQTPWQILGVEPRADKETIRKAYLAKLKEYPPESHPEEFDSVKNAWAALRDPDTYAALCLDAIPPLPTLDDFEKEPRREFVGPEAWAKVLKG